MIHATTKPTNRTKPYQMNDLDHNVVLNLINITFDEHVKCIY